MLVEFSLAYGCDRFGDEDNYCQWLQLAMEMLAVAMGWDGDNVETSSADMGGDRDDKYGDGSRYLFPCGCLVLMH